MAHGSKRQRHSVVERVISWFGGESARHGLSFWYSSVFGETPLPDLCSSKIIRVRMVATTKCPSELHICKAYRFVTRRVCRKMWALCKTLNEFLEDTSALSERRFELRHSDRCRSAQSKSFQKKQKKVLRFWKRHVRIAPWDCLAPHASAFFSASETVVNRIEHRWKKPFLGELQRRASLSSKRDQPLLDKPRAAEAAKIAALKEILQVFVRQILCRHILYIYMSFSQIGRFVDLPWTKPWC